MANDGGNNAAMAILVIALVAVVGIFVYFMSTSHNQNMVIQTPAPQVNLPSAPTGPTPDKSQ